MMRRRLGIVRSHLFTLGAVVSAYAVGYVATIRTRELFVPDSRYYGGMSLWYGGTSQESAAHQIAQYSARFGWAGPPADQIFGWGLVQPRVVYPLLSVPFVKLFGIQGLAVVPGVAMALLVIVMTVVLGRRFGYPAAVGTTVMVCASSQLMFYGSAMLTESLSALWGALLLAVAWRNARAPFRSAAALLVGLTIVAGFTRQATLIPAGAFVVAWLGAVVTRQNPNPWRLPALTVGVTAVGVQVLQMLLFPGFSQIKQFKSRAGADSLAEAIWKSPQLAWNIVRTDVINVNAVDRVLVVFLALALISMVLLWRRSESHLLLGALLAYELYNVTNGVPTAFRYIMPGLAFCATSVALLLAEAGSVSRSRTGGAEQAARGGQQPAAYADSAPRGE
jgi:hypothetical protein